MFTLLLQISMFWKQDFTLEQNDRRKTSDLWKQDTDVTDSQLHSRALGIRFFQTNKECPKTWKGSLWTFHSLHMPLLFSDQPGTAENSTDRKLGSAALWFQQILQQNHPSKGAYWLLWGKSSRCAIVTNEWFKVFSGVILLSASIVNIFFNKSMYSLRSAFSANMSVPSKSVDIFTCKIKWEQSTQAPN